jgi:hypothetical protein
MLPDLENKIKITTVFIYICIYAENQYSSMNVSIYGVWPCVIQELTRRVPIVEKEQLHLRSVQVQNWILVGSVLLDLYVFV